jgi:membrane protease YdiL (CAAX protease family)
MVGMDPVGSTALPAAEREVLTVKLSLLALVSAFVVAQVFALLAMGAAVGLLLLTDEIQLRELAGANALAALLGRPLVLGSSLLGTQLGLAATAFAFSRIARVDFLRVTGLTGARRTRSVSVALAVALIIAAGPVAGTASVLVARAAPELTLGTLDTISGAVRGDLVDAVLVGLAVALAPAVCEELVFRGLLLRAFTHRLGPATGVLLSSMLFGLIHVDPPQAAGALVLGLVLGWVTYRAGSLWPAMAAHAANNALAVVVARTTEPEPLTSVSLDGLELAGSVTLTAALSWAFVRVTRAAPSP